MTLQLGLVGSDGVVMASDKRITSTDVSERASCSVTPVGARTLSSVSKFHFGQNFICCASGDDTAWHAAVDIAHMELDEVPEYQGAKDVASALEAKANKACIQRESTDKDGIPRSALIVDRLGQLWHLNISQQSTAKRIFDLMVIGDVHNNARFYVTHYYPGAKSETRQLVTLAASAILMGGRENRVHVDGLEIVVCRDKEFVRLRSSDIEQLVSRVDALHEDTKRKLLEPFDWIV